MESHGNVQNRKWILAGSVAALLIGTLVAGLLVARKAATSAKNTRALAEAHTLDQFHKVVSPILQKRCYDCHGDGAHKAGIAFDALATNDQIHNPQLWLKVLRNTRSHIMPPPSEEQPTVAEQQELEKWIKTGGFGLYASQPDPGRVTIRRLNRTEYKNTLRDLLKVNFDADTMLPPDDVGYGFDNIGDVLSISPLRLEKFVEAAMTAVEHSVPMDTVVMSTKTLLGGDFLTADGRQNAERYSYYQARTTSHTFDVKTAGEYRVMVNTKIDGEAAPVDPQHAHVVWKCDGKVILDKDYKWSDMEYLSDTFNFKWDAGDHVVSCDLTPVFPELQPLRTKMEYRVLFVVLDGPLEKEKWEHHPNYNLFFTRDTPPKDPAARHQYASEVLSNFVTKAYRRPPAPETVDQLVKIAEDNYSLPGVTFEKGISQAIIAVLASPRFLFHLEYAEPSLGDGSFARIDEYSLASRLSYALWSSMPDEELMQLASRGELRKNFQAQVKRMLADPKAGAFSENFADQWLQTRSILDIPINSAVVMASETPPSTSDGTTVTSPAPAPAVAAPVVAATNGPAGGAAVAAGGPPGFGARGRRGGAGFAGGGFGGRGGGGRRGRAAPGTELTPEIRTAMKAEVDAYFDYIVHQDRSVLELLQSNYAFVNDQLAALYGIPNVNGPEIRRVDLPQGNVRGGVLTMGGVLTVTSNPTRTSPVKRGKWILQNILGAPPAPPPPNVPALEDTKAKTEIKSPTQRELLALHRADPLCSSCHSRMDPLGLAMENFNAFGRVRQYESGKPIDPSGELAMGEKISGVLDLKQTLVENHRMEFYRTLTEKLMTYVLGRGVEYYDVPTVDAIAERLDKDNGRFSTLLLGILESAPFQERRPIPNSTSREAQTAEIPASTSNKL